jgi:hypothetical protein
MLKSWNTANFARDHTCLAKSPAYMQSNECTHLAEQNALGEGGARAQPSEKSSEVPLQGKCNGLTEVENSANKSAVERKDHREQEGDAAVMVALKVIRKVRVRVCRADGHRV